MNMEIQRWIKDEAFRSFPHDQACEVGRKEIEKKFKLTYGDGNCMCDPTTTSNRRRFESSLYALLAEIEAKVKDMKAAHIRWSNTELAEYARGGKETCEDILEYLRPSEPKKD